jgi:hypothetical protein
MKENGEKNDWKMKQDSGHGGSKTYRREMENQPINKDSTRTKQQEAPNNQQSTIKDITKRKKGRDGESEYGSME